MKGSASELGLTITSQFAFAFDDNPRRLRFQNVFCPHSNLKSDFEKLRFLYGIVWTVGLSMRFQISPVSSDLHNAQVLFEVVSIRMSSVNQ